MATLGPVAFQKCRKKIDARNLSFLPIAAGLATGIAILALGDSSVWLFTALCVVFCASAMAIRPYTVEIMLHMNEGRAGAASSALNFVSTALGAAGMIVVMLFDNLVLGFAVMVVFSSTISLILWTAYLCDKTPA